MRVFRGMYSVMPGLRFYPPSRLYEHTVEEHSVRVVGLYHTEGLHEAKLHGRVIRIEITSPLENVLRVKATHHAAGKVRERSFLLESLSPCRLTTAEEEEIVRVTSGRLSAALGRKDWNVSFSWNSTFLCESGRDSLGLLEIEGGGLYMAEKLSLKPGECVYGLGERFSPFLRNGQSVVMWNTDPAAVSDLAYKNIPFYLSSDCYGILVNTPAKVEFEVATEDNSGVRIVVPGTELEYLVIAGESPAEVLERLTALTGRPPLIPKWSLGLWLTTSFTTVYDERTVMEHVEGMVRRGIPLTVFHFDCYWMRERHWVDFQWDRTAFPDPEGMIARMKSQGLKLCAWINPYVSELSALFAEGARKGYFLKRPTGEVYQVDWWQPGIAFVDFTNLEARAWYCEKLGALLDMGVDCFKTDFGESAPEDAVYADGADGALMHNLYTLLYNRTVFELLERRRGAGEALVFARSATAGCQRYPIHWGGDSVASYASMAAELRGGLSFCLSGGSFWSHDIGGFYGKATPDLYKRWVAFGLLSSHSRLHGDDSYRVPWNFDEEAVTVLRHFTRLRHTLLPYMYSYCCAAHETGLPLMRPMLLEFPRDLTCRFLDRQYLLGAEILVAPVLNPDGHVDFYLPAGEWTDFFTGEVVEGGKWATASFDYFSLPLFIRENSIIPTGSVEDAPSRSSFDSLLLTVYRLKTTGSFTVQDGTRTVRVKVGRSGEELFLSLSEPIEGLRVVFKDVPQPKEVKGAASLDSEASVVLVSGTHCSVR